MQRRLRNATLLVAALACFAAVAVIAAALAIVPRPEFRRWLGERLAAETGTSVAFSSISIAFWPAPGVRLHGVSLGEIGAKADQRGFTIQSIGCTLRMASLLRGEVVVDGVFIEQPSLSIERDSAGRWIVGTALQRLLARATSEKPAGPSSGAAPHPLPHFALRDGTFTLNDRRVSGGPVQLRVEHLDADVDPPLPERSGRVRIAADGAAGAHLEIDATIAPTGLGAPLAEVPFEAAVHGQSLGSDDALLYLLFGLPIRNAGGLFDIAGSVSRGRDGQIEGSASIDLSRGFVDGWGIRVATPMRLAASFGVEDGRFSMHRARLRAPRISFSRYEGSNPTAVFDWSAGNLLVDAFDFDAYGGAWKTKGLVSFGDKPRFQLEVQADQVTFRDLILAVTGSELTNGFETVSAEGAVRGVWAGADAWLATLSGSGQATLAGGQIKSSPVMRSILAALFRRIPGISKMKFGDAKGRSTDVERLTASFALRDSKIFSDDIDFRTSDYRMKGRGSVGLNGSLDVAADVILTAHGVEGLYVIAARPFRKVGDRSLPSVPVKLSGTLVDPVVIPDVSGISLAPLRMLFDGARGTVGLPGDTADVGGESLKRDTGKASGLGEDQGGGDATDGRGVP